MARVVEDHPPPSLSLGKNATMTGWVSHNPRHAHLRKVTNQEESCCFVSVSNFFVSLVVAVVVLGVGVVLFLTVVMVLFLFCFFP